MRKTKRWILWVSKLFVLVVYLVLVAYAVIAGMAFVLKLLGADPTSDFADWVYRAAANITEPFRGIFPTTPITSRSEFDASLLFAALIYIVLAVALHALIDWLAREIAGVDRAQVRAEREAALAQQEQALATLAYEPAAAGTSTAPTTDVLAGSWNQPPADTASATAPVPPAPPAGSWTPGMPVEPPEPLLPSD